MVHVVSEKAFSLSDFVFRKAVVYDNNEAETGAGSMTSEDVPGLSGTYSYTSTVSLWDGSGTVGNATDYYQYTGSNLVANFYGAPISGTVTGLFVGNTEGQAAIIGTTINAADIHVASLTTTTRQDDLAILRAALSGDDTAQLSAFGDYFWAQTGNDRVWAGAGNDTINGMQGRDRIYGEDGDDYLRGGYGYDRVNGGKGSDTLLGDAGDDTLIGMQDKDFIYGGDGDDSVLGGYGYDRLDGGVGADTIIGGSGVDRMTGGADEERDVFVFAHITDSYVTDSGDVRRDLVSDFVAGIDVLDLSNLDANTAFAGDQAFAYTSSTASKNAVWFQVRNWGVLVHADVDGDGVADFSVRVEDVKQLSVSDFIL